MIIVNFPLRLAFTSSCFRAQKLQIVQEGLWCGRKVKTACVRSKRVNPYDSTYRVGCKLIVMQFQWTRNSHPLVKKKLKSPRLLFQRWPSIRVGTGLREDQSVLSHVLHPWVRLGGIYAGHEDRRLSGERANKMAWCVSPFLPVIIIQSHTHLSIQLYK